LPLLDPLGQLTVSIHGRLVLVTDCCEGRCLTRGIGPRSGQRLLQVADALLPPVPLGNGGPQLQPQPPWHYPASHTTLLWECSLERHFRDHPLPEDPNMKGLWQSVEGYILSRFPKTARIITTDKDQMFDHGWGTDVKYYKVNYTGIP
jgi:hypothetical protein